MTNEKEKTWGGARQGAGRKKQFDGKSVTFISSKEVQQYLEQYEGSRSELINALLLDYFTKKGA